MGYMLASSDKDFKTLIIKMLKWTIASRLELNENKIRKFQQKKKKKGGYKDKPNVNFRTEKKKRQ